ncbi:MAG: HAMP domain-containing sensor histidine kinase [Acidobacteriota bacterium]
MQDSNVRGVQVAFLVILAVSAAQALWWIYDLGVDARVTHGRWRALYHADAEAARELLAKGVEPDWVASRFLHLEVEGNDVRISSAALASLREERRRKISQYSWEGAFFFLVLLASMAVIWRAVRRDAQLRRWQDNFLAAVSHELKSPIASLQLAAETLAIRDLDAGGRTKVVGRILADVERLGATVANVLDTYRLDQRAVALDRQTVRLLEAVEEAVTEQSYRARDAGVEMLVDIPASLTLSADPAGIRAVLRNLLDNALKATETGGRVTVSARQEGRGVRLDVADDGVGFPPEKAERLFEKFYRVGPELRRTRTGSGLGLYLVRGSVTLEGGDVTAASEGPGRGATFSVLWPRVGES